MVLLHPAELLRSLNGAVLLEPVGARITPAGEAADVELRRAGVLALAVGVETGNTQFGACVSQTVYVKIIDGVGVEGLATDTEVIHQVRGHGMGVADGVVLGEGGNIGGVELNRRSVGDL